MAIPAATRKGERPSILQCLTAHPAPATSNVKSARFPTAPRCAQIGRDANNTPLIPATAPNWEADSAHGSRHPATWPMITGCRSAWVYEE